MNTPTLLRNAMFAFPAPDKLPDGTLSGGGLVRYTVGPGRDGKPNAILDIEGVVTDETSGFNSRAILVVRGSNYAGIRQKLLAAGFPAEFLPATQVLRGQPRRHESGYVSQLVGFQPDVIGVGWFKATKDETRKVAIVESIPSRTEWLATGFGRDIRVSPVVDTDEPTDSEADIPSL